MELESEIWEGNLNSKPPLASQVRTNTVPFNTALSGADVNAQSSYGDTALKLAARRNQGIWVERYGVKDTIIEKLLLDHGANPNIGDHSGKTALMEAAAAGNEELVKLLLDHGASPVTK